MCAAVEAPVRASREERPPEVVRLLDAESACVSFFPQANASFLPPQNPQPAANP